MRGTAEALWVRARGSLVPTLAGVPAVREFRNKPTRRRYEGYLAQRDFISATAVARPAKRAREMMA